MAVIVFVGYEICDHDSLLDLGQNDRGKASIAAIEFTDEEVYEASLGDSILRIAVRASGELKRRIDGPTDQGREFPSERCGITWVKFPP
ncbi:MAG: hypothetical protein WBA88_04175 [Pseudaminobacter sp.]